MGSWEYLPLLNECIKILLTISFGVVTGYSNVFDAKQFCPQATKFIFNVALPLLVLRGLGAGVDFYDERFPWMYILAFLILRVIALVAAIALVILQQGRNGIGQVVVWWLTLSWISTVILGIPISQAVFGNPQKGVFYGLVSVYS